MIANANKMQSMGNIPVLLVGVQTCAITEQINMVVHWEAGIVTTSRPSHTALGHISNRLYATTHKDTCSSISIEAYIIITRNWKHPRYPSTRVWIKKMCYISNVKYLFRRPGFPHEEILRDKENLIYTSFSW